MLSQEQVKHIAQLARLGLRDKEIKKMQKEMAVILDYIKLLNEVDVSQAGEASYTGFEKNVMRQDKVKPESPQVVEAMTDQSPAKQDGYIKVKRVLS